MFLAIDYGKKRIGLAAGQIYPKGLGVLDGAKSTENLIGEIRKVVDENEIDRIVIGMPYRSQGEEGTIAQEIRQFGQMVADVTLLPICFEAEQFTSTEAREILLESNQKFSRKTGEVDELAAVLLLEQFLNRLESDQQIDPDINPTTGGK